MPTKCKHKNSCYCLWNVRSLFTEICNQLMGGGEGGVCVWGGGGGGV